MEMNYLFIHVRKAVIWSALFIVLACSHSYEVQDDPIIKENKVQDNFSVIKMIHRYFNLPEDFDLQGFCKSEIISYDQMNVLIEPLKGDKKKLEIGPSDNPFYDTEDENTLFVDYFFVPRMEVVYKTAIAQKRLFIQSAQSMSFLGDKSIDQIFLQGFPWYASSNFLGNREKYFLKEEDYKNIKFWISADLNVFIIPLITESKRVLSDDGVIITSCTMAQDMRIDSRHYLHCVAALQLGFKVKIFKDGVREIMMLTLK